MSSLLKSQGQQPAHGVVAGNVDPMKLAAKVDDVAVEGFNHFCGHPKRQRRSLGGQPGASDPLPAR